jgi:hypothetical protein
MQSVQNRHNASGSTQRLWNDLFPSECTRRARNHRNVDVCNVAEPQIERRGGRTRDDMAVEPPRIADDGRPLHGG